MTRDEARGQSSLTGNVRIPSPSLPLPLRRPRLVVLLPGLVRGRLPLLSRRSDKALLRHANVGESRHAASVDYVSGLEVSNDVNNFLEPVLPPSAVGGSKSGEVEVKSGESRDDRFMSSERATRVVSWAIEVPGTDCR